MKKALALVLAAAMALSFVACGGSGTTTSTSQTGESTSTGAASTTGNASGGRVYYLNFKPEQADQWVELAAKYTEETGDTNISTFQFKTQDGNANGYAADWHPTAKTHDIAAAELTEYIKSLM